MNEHELIRIKQFRQFKKKIRGSKQGFDKLLEETTAVQKQHGFEKRVFGMESTGNYHKPLAQWLMDQDHMIVLVTGKSVKEKRQLLDGRWDKTIPKTVPILLI